MSDGKISGTVTIEQESGAGDPFNAFIVGAIDKSDSENCRFHEPDKSGNFMITGLAHGSYDVVVFKKGNNPGTCEAKVVVLVEGNNTANGLALTVYV